MINASYFERCREENERESGMDMWPHKYTIRVSLTDTRPPKKPYPVENTLSPVVSSRRKAGREDDEYEKEYSSKL